mgnify:CR=1 FL=1
MLFLTVVFFSVVLQTLCVRAGIDIKVSGRLISINKRLPSSLTRAGSCKFLN